MVFTISNYLFLSIDCIFNIPSIAPHANPVKCERQFILDPSITGECMKIMKARNYIFVFFLFLLRTVNVVTIPKIAPDAPAETIVPRNKFVILVEIPVIKNTKITNNPLELFSNLIPYNHKLIIFNKKCRIAI